VGRLLLGDVQTTAAALTTAAHAACGTHHVRRQDALPQWVIVTGWTVPLRSVRPLNSIHFSASYLHTVITIRAPNPMPYPGIGYRRHRSQSCTQWGGCWWPTCIQPRLHWPRGCMLGGGNGIHERGASLAQPWMANCEPAPSIPWQTSEGLPLSTPLLQRTTPELPGRV
jgi:hypothetical protein